LPRLGRAMATGSPVRHEIADLDQRPPAESGVHSGDLKTLLVLGGSQGASAVNEMLIGFAKQSAEALAGWRVVHQAGAADAVRVRQAYAETEIGRAHV